jgi:hypothetical protein
MTNVDWAQVEAELGLVVPRAYRNFLDIAISRGYDLRRFNICHDAASLVSTNNSRREMLRDAEPRWCHGYLDVGVGDGCGNHFFLHANRADDDTVQLWAHDPSGIEDVGSATEFFAELLAELEQGFEGPNRHRFDGSAIAAMPARPPRANMINPFTGKPI